MAEHPPTGHHNTYIDHLFISDGDLHAVLAVVQRVLPLVEQEEQPQLSCCVLLQRILDGDEVLQGLGHLAAFNGQVTGMQEIPHPVVIVVIRLQSNQLQGKCVLITEVSFP